MAGSQKSIEILHAAAVEVSGVGVTSALEPLSVAGKGLRLTVRAGAGVISGGANDNIVISKFCSSR